MEYCPVTNTLRRIRWCQICLGETIKPIHVCSSHTCKCSFWQIRGCYKTFIFEHAQALPLKRFSYGFFNLFVGCGSVKAFCGLEALMAEHVLGFLHQEASLVKKCPAGVASEMPVHAFLDAGSSGHLTDHFVAVAVVSYVCQSLQ